ncbi:MAG: L-threonylcarbamoyladenylate synthase [Bacteriovoracia bacterium]
MKAKQKTRILKANQIDQACRALKRGQLVVIPTETVYGLAADAFEEASVVEIFRVKKRPFFDPLIVHIPENKTSIEELERSRLVDGTKLNSKQRKIIDSLARAFWPGPLTLVLPKTKQVPDIVTSGLDSIAIRCPKHLLTQKVLKKSGLFLAAPSANLFGKTSPTRAQDAKTDLNGRVRWILDGGPCTVGIESTVLQIYPTLKILRLGGVSRTQLESVLKIKLSYGSERKKKRAPGLLENHYAPEKQLYLVGDLEKSLKLKNMIRKKKISYLAAHGSKKTCLTNFEKRFGIRPASVHVLSEKRNPLEAAKNLFSYFRALSREKTDIIVCDLWPDPQKQTIGAAINDRIQKASVKPPFLC